MTPLDNYEKYHQSPENKLIHVVCIPLIAITLLSLLTKMNIYYSLMLKLFYETIYISFLGINSRGLGMILYLESLHILSKLFYYLNNNYLLILHLTSWILQFVGHGLFENNKPALLDNLYQSFLWAPLMPYMHFFKYENYAYKTEIKMEIIKNDKYEGNKKTIICFGGLKQSMKKFHSEKIKLTNYFEIILIKIKPGIDYDIDNVVNFISEKLPNYPIDAVAFSFGASVLQKLATNIEFNKIILISPSGHLSNTFFENLIIRTSAFFYKLNNTSFWKIMSLYPTYGLTDFKLENMKKKELILYGSFDDVIHPYQESFEKVADKLKIYDGGHFGAFYNWTLDYQEKERKKNKFSWLFKPYYKYHLVLNTLIAIYTFKLYYFHYIFLGTMSWTVLEYFYHRYLQHFFFRESHWKHHIYPHKENFIHLSGLITKLYEIILIRGLICSYIFNMSYDQTNMFNIGIYISFVCFETSHSMSHKSISEDSFFYKIKIYHKYHHSNPVTNFGFTTPSYDYLFGTMNKGSNVSTLKLILGFILPIVPFL